MNKINEHLVHVILSEEDVKLLTTAIGLDHPASGVVKRIIYQANDSPIFCSSYNKPIRHLNPKAAVCQPFPFACYSCPMGMYEGD